MHNATRSSYLPDAYVTQRMHLMQSLLLCVVHVAVYVKWRTLIILCYRGLLAHTTAVLFYASSAKMEQPVQWIEAILKIAVFKSRVTVPIFHFMSFQVAPWVLEQRCCREA